MDGQKDNIRIIITKKADAALDDLAKKFNLEESPEESIKRSREGKHSKMVIVSLLAKDFVKGLVPGENLINSLQKDLEVSPQTASEISKEIINKIAPFLEKAPEEKFKDPAFREEMSKKISGTEKSENKGKPFDVFPNIKSPINISETIENKKSTEEFKNKDITPAKKQERIKKPVALEENNAPRPRQPRGPDNYREPIG